MLALEKPERPVHVSDLSFRHNVREARPVPWVEVGPVYDEKSFVVGVELLFVLKNADTRECVMG